MKLKAGYYCYLYTTGGTVVIDVSSAIGTFLGSIPGVPQDLRAGSENYRAFMLDLAGQEGLSVAGKGARLDIIGPAS